jgi:hypothetical protein
LIVAVIVAVVVEETELVVMANVAVLLPAATVTVAGTVIELALLMRETTAPPVGAAIERVTVPVEVCGYMRIEGATTTLAGNGPWTVRFAELFVNWSVPVITAVTVVAGRVVAIANVAVEVPAGTTTEEGTVAFVDELLKLTVQPPVGAVDSRVTVPWEDVPPVRLDGLTTTEVRLSAATLNATAFEVIESVALIAFEMLFVVGRVVIGNVAVDCPEATTIDAGTETSEGFALLRVTDQPFDGAGFVRVIVPVEEVPPVKDIGLIERFEIA